MKWALYSVLYVFKYVFLPLYHAARQFFQTMFLSEFSVSNNNICCCSVTKSCLTLCNPVDYSPPGPSVHVISEARILEWVAISSSRGSSQPQGSNLHLLRWQADSSPLGHQESPIMTVKNPFYVIYFPKSSLANTISQGLYGASLSW